MFAKRTTWWNVIEYYLNLTVETSGKRRQPGVKRDPYADLTVLQRAIILQLMNAPPSELGTHVSAIAIGVSHHDVTPDQVG